MHKFQIIIRDEALKDLENITLYLLENGGTQAAQKFKNQFDEFANSLAEVPHRGTIHNESLTGLRIVGLEKRATIAFVVEVNKVVILRVIYKGGDWTREI